MDRRGFLRTGTATLAAGLLRDSGQAQSSGVSQRLALAQAAAPDTRSAKKLKVDAYSRHLQWLRSADEVAKATIEMGYTGVDITVRPYPGHVDPAKVATDLPPFVKTIRDHGLDVRMITCNIAEAGSPYAEDILKAAAGLSIHHYWWGTYRYDPGKPVMEQLDALKPRIEKLQALNKKYDMKAMYHLYSMPNSIGCNVWDMLSVLRNFDPKYISFHWDVGHTSVTGGNGSWAESLRASGPYVGGVSVKEYTWDLNLAKPGIGAQAASGQASAGQQESAAPALGPSGVVTPGGPRGPQPRGGLGQPLPWRTKAVQLGEGINNLPLLATVLKEINFEGPLEIQAEYPNGGADNARDTLTLPVPVVLGNMKHDLLALKAAFGPSGLL